MRFARWAVPITLIALLIHVVAWLASPGPGEVEGRLYQLIHYISPKLIDVLMIYLVAYIASGIHVVNQWDRRPIMRLGRYVRTLSGGISWVDPITTRGLSDINTRQIINTLKVEHVQTHDNVPIELKFIMTAQVEDAEKYVLAVDGGWQAMQNRARAVVAEFIGGTELDPILHERSTLSSKILETVRSRVAAWGIKVEAVEISDISITDESISKAISMKARAKKEAEAELARAKMQGEIAKQLVAAASQFNVDAWRLKRMEVLLELCRSGKNNTILIPTELTDAISTLAPALRQS